MHTSTLGLKSIVVSRIKWFFWGPYPAKNANWLTCLLSKISTISHEAPSALQDPVPHLQGPMRSLLEPWSIERKIVHACTEIEHACLSRLHLHVWSPSYTNWYLDFSTCAAASNCPNKSSRVSTSSATRRLAPSNIEFTISAYSMLKEQIWWVYFIGKFIIQISVERERERVWCYKWPEALTRGKYLKREEMGNARVTHVEYIRDSKAYGAWKAECIYY